MRACKAIEKLTGRFDSKSLLGRIFFRTRNDFGNFLLKLFAGIELQCGPLKLIFNQGH
jgi:hypothetical protein